MTFHEIIRVVSILIVLFAFYYGISMVMLKRSVLNVIRIFKEKKALSLDTAVSWESLGVVKQGMLDRAVKKKDNRIHALKFLMGHEIIVTTSNENYYFDKIKLADFRKKGNFAVRFLIPNLDK